MSIKTHNIKTIGKFSLGYFSPDEKNPEKLYSIDLGHIFWNLILNKKYLNSFNSSTSENINSFTEKLEEAKHISGKIHEEIMTSLELFFIYNIFTKTLAWLNAILRDWKIDFIRGITHKNNGFVCEKVDYSILDITSDNYLKDILEKIISRYKFGAADTLVFNVFWPAEIIQVLLIAEILKSKQPNLKIILNFENANEQFDFESFVNDQVQKNYHRYAKIDFINVFKGGLQESFDSNARNHTNIFYNTETRFVIDKAPFEKEDIRTSFIKNLYNRGMNAKRAFGKKYVNIRMYPFRCYWSSCFFCTINKGNENIFPHNDFDRVREYVDIVIEYIQKEKPYYINFIDEAIFPAALEYFVDRILELGIKINYRYRARFDEKYLSGEFLEKLYKSGARYCGVGLESASERINKMFNKGDGKIGTAEKIAIIKNFNDHHIPFHNYSIFGFPGEKKEESLLTFRFLCANIETSDHYTCTPNIYGLMKGSVIHNNPEKFGIEIIEANGDLIGNYLDNGKPRNIAALYQLTDAVNKQQFTRYLDNVNPRDFWDFIDRVGIFYYFKSVYRKNPYLFPFSHIQKLLENEKLTYLTRKFKKTNFFTISGENRTLFSFITYKQISLSEDEKNFLEKYDENKTLQENIGNLSLSKDFIPFLLRNFILSNHEEDARTLYNEGL